MHFAHPFPTFRIRETAEPTEQVLQIQQNGHWSFLCDETWEMLNAHAACRSLGSDYALSIPATNAFNLSEDNATRISINMECTGYEGKIIHLGTFMIVYSSASVDNLSVNIFVDRRVFSHNSTDQQKPCSCRQNTQFIFCIHALLLGLLITKITMDEYSLDHL